MVDVTHDEAVNILKATEDSVVLRVEKNAIAHTGSPASPDEEVCIHVRMYESSVGNTELAIRTQ